jgi:hypothetical protein
MSDRLLTIEDIRSLGYDVDELAPRVFSVNNFLTPEETDLLFAEVKSYSEESWSVHWREELEQNCMRKFGRIDIEQLVKEGLLEISPEFVDRNKAFENVKFREMIDERCQEIFNSLGSDLEHGGFSAFLRQAEGSELKAHYDQYSDKLIEYAAVLYFHDDYTDGELFFENFDLELKPKPGSLIIFPGTKDYVHGVRFVGPGPIRYNIPTFIKRSSPDGFMSGWGDFG